MTSSIPMFQVSQVSPRSFIFNHSVTDPMGLIDKINYSDFLGSWSRVNQDSDQCFDVKINHEKNNIYYKHVDFLEVDNTKNLYILNSLKMAFWSTTDMYCKAYSLRNNRSMSASIYKQDVSYIFDDIPTESETFRAILFLNDSEKSSDFIVSESGFVGNISPKMGSVLIMPPGSSYKTGHFHEGARYYAVYDFTADII